MYLNSKGNAHFQDYKDFRAINNWYQNVISNCKLMPVDANLSLPKRIGIGVSIKILLILVLAIILLRTKVVPYLPPISKSGTC